MPPPLTPRSQGRRHADRQAEARLRELTAATQRVREQDRTRISRELHDDIGQLLAAVRMDVGLLLRAQGLAPSEHHLLKQVDSRIHDAIVSLRRIAAALRPHALDHGGLFPAIQALQHDFCKRSGMQCSLFADEADLQFDDDDFNTGVYRIVQEGLHNAIAHSGGTAVTMSLYRLDHQLLITIADDGKGIEETDLHKPGSLGLLGMRERVLALGGDISVGKDEGGGTRIDVTLPLPQVRPAEDDALPPGSGI